MDPIHVLEQIDQGLGLPEWRIFRYSKTRCIIRVLLNIVWITLFLFGTLIVSGYLKSPSIHIERLSSNYILIGSLVLGLAINLYYLYKNLREMHHCENNIIVVTKDNIIKRICNRKEVYNLNNVANIVEAENNGFALFIPFNTVEFTDAEAKTEVALVMGDLFGKASKIHKAIRSTKYVEVPIKQKEPDNILN
jgi:hypothetical protein